eukprot:3619353-Amphidinium_carterae.1
MLQDLAPEDYSVHVQAPLSLDLPDAFEPPLLSASSAASPPGTRSDSAAHPVPLLQGGQLAPDAPL